MTARSNGVLNALPRWREPLGIERLFCALHDQVEGCGRVVFIARFTGPLDDAAVERALRQVTVACPRSRIQIGQLANGNYEYRVLDQPPEPVVQFRAVSDAAEGAALAAELGAELMPPGREPVLRWVVLAAGDGTFQIVGLAHHALFDAASIAILIRRFLEVLDRVAVPEWKWLEPTVPRAGWQTFRRHWAGVAHHFSEDLWPIRRCRGLPRVADGAETCVTHRWTAAETTRLTLACRQAQTTVTAVLGITGLFAARAHYGEALTHADLVIPMNLRRFLPAEEADAALGLLIAVQNYAIDFRRPVSLREQAQRIARHTRYFLDHEGPLRLFRSVNLFTPRRMVMKNGIPVCVSANSLGRMTAPPARTGVRWIECGWFAHGGQYMPAFSQTAATIDDCLSVTSYSNWIGSEHTRDLAADVDARLRHFAGLQAVDTEAMTARTTAAADSGAIAAMR